MTFPSAGEVDASIEAVQCLLENQCLTNFEIATVDGELVRERPVLVCLEAAGFYTGYRGEMFRG